MPSRLLPVQAVLILGLLILAIPSLAFMGGKDGRFAWINDRDKRTGEACCGENDCYTNVGNPSSKNKDTSRIENIVSHPSGGYEFDFQGHHYAVSFRDVKPSEDGYFWACIPRPALLRCFFAPPLGS